MLLRIARVLARVNLKRKIIGLAELQSNLIQNALFTPCEPGDSSFAALTMIPAQLDAGAFVGCLIYPAPRQYLQAPSRRPGEGIAPQCYADSPSH